MIQELRLRGFKNFRDATLRLGNLTLLVGTNASGKSNLRDAFRFLHGVSRGYTLAEILGTKYIEGGAIQWTGIRGGTREVAYYGSQTFSLELKGTLPDANSYQYRIDVELDANGRPPRVLRESMYLYPYCSGCSELVFDSRPQNKPPNQDDPNSLTVLVGASPGSGDKKQLKFKANRPILSQITDHDECRLEADMVVSSLGSMRFLDLTPEAMRAPSIPGQDILGDRGENLSSVLQAICESETSKHAILEWIRELTPQDVVDFEFVPDQTGKILVSLVESSGRKISAYSASDGTLRFLAIIAAMLGPQSARLYFIEELENGIHPTRLTLLLQLIEQKVSEEIIQVIATSHSPQLLGFLNEQSRQNAALVYRLPDQPDARIKPIIQIPDAERILKEQDLARLHSSGWLEDAVAFLEGAEA